MSSFIPLYPTLSVDSISTIKKELIYHFSDKESESVDLQNPKNIDLNTNEVLLGHDKNWSAEINDLTYIHSFRFNNGLDIFGANGVTPENGKLEIYLRVFSSDSNQRFLSEQKFVLTKESQSELISLSVLLPAKQFFGRVYVVPIALTTEVLEDNTIFAKLPGLYLGELCNRITLTYDGSGSYFPITTIKDLGAPLWRFVCQRTYGPSVDLFNKTNISLCINEQHPHSIELQNPKGALFFQIICAWHTELILWFKEQDSELLTLFGMHNKEELINNGDFEVGSIADYLYEFIKNHNVITNEISSIGNSIRKYMTL